MGCHNFHVGQGLCLLLYLFSLWREYSCRWVSGTGPGDLNPARSPTLGEIYTKLFKFFVTIVKGINLACSFSPRAENCYWFYSLWCLTLPNSPMNSNSFLVQSFSFFYVRAKGTGKKGKFNFLLSNVFFLLNVWLKLPESYWMVTVSVVVLVWLWILMEMLSGNLFCHSG